MNLIEGITKEDHSDYVIYVVECITDELKNEIRNRLSSICHGVDQPNSEIKAYSYNETVKKFIDRCKSENNEILESRVIGMIGELLVHIILEIEGRFLVASPFFNMEEDSFKKGYDIVLYDTDLQEIWITETKSGEMQKRQKTSSAASLALINKAKNDLKERLNNHNTTPWLNALNAARIYVSESNTQREMVIKLLGQVTNDVVDKNNSSNTFNVVLSAVLFNPLTDLIDAKKIGRKYSKVIVDGLFKKVFIICVQKGTYQAVYKFLEGEINNEI